MTTYTAVDVTNFRNLPAIKKLDELERRLAIGDTSAEICSGLNINRYELSHLKRVSRKLSDTAKQLIARNDLSDGHARALARVSGTLQETLARDTIQHHWSVRRLEQEVRSRLEGKDAPRDQAYYDHISEIISQYVSHPVSVAPDTKDPRKGKIVITYADFTCFDSILDRLRVPVDALK